MTTLSKVGDLFFFFHEDRQRSYLQGILAELRKRRNTDINQKDRWTLQIMELWRCMTSVATFHHFLLI